MRLTHEGNEETHITIVKCDAHCLHNESGLCGKGEIELSMDWSVICETLDLKPLEEVLEWESVRDEEAAKRMRAHRECDTCIM